MSQKKKKKAKSFMFWAKSQEMSLEAGRKVGLLKVFCTGHQQTAAERGETLRSR